MVTRHTKESVAKKLLIILGNFLICIDATFLDILKYFSVRQYSHWFMTVVDLHSVKKSKTDDR